MEVRGPIEASSERSSPATRRRFRGWKSAAPLKLKPHIPRSRLRELFPRMEVHGLSVSNSSSGRRWKLDHAPAVGDPPHRVAFGPGRRAFARDASRRVAFHRRMAPCRGVVGLEVGERPLQITGIPAQHMIQEFSPHRPDQPFHTGV